MKLDRGCVQGSVLGPKLFSLYVGGLAKEINRFNNNTKIISFADDTYVIATSESWEKLPSDAEKLIKFHSDYLKTLGMTVNESKTEILVLGKRTLKDELTLTINGNKCKESSTIKALGIHIDGNLSWDAQAEHAFKKGQKLVSIFKHVRKYMTETQYLKTRSFMGPVCGFQILSPSTELNLRRCISGC
jgi:hypothetical protein